MGIFGMSRGATLGSMVAVNNSDISLLILESGNYDQISRKTTTPTYLNGILENISKEAGDSKKPLSSDLLSIIQIK